MSTSLTNDYGVHVYTDNTKYFLSILCLFYDLVFCKRRSNLLLIAALSNLLIKLRQDILSFSPVNPGILVMTDDCDVELFMSVVMSKSESVVTVCVFGVFDFLVSLGVGLET